METLKSFDATTISYEARGEGPEVVLVHGITESSKMWDPVTERLAGDHRVVTLDLRGHGQSGNSDRYDLEAMARDVGEVVAATGLTNPHIVGHSLGGAVVSAVGADMSVASVVNVDQSLNLGDFKAGLAPAEPMLRDPETFPGLLAGLFSEMEGTLLSQDEISRMASCRRAEQDVVLGVWELIFTKSEQEIGEVVDAALAGYAEGDPTPYLSLHGIDPGDGYGDWLAGRVPSAVIELWADHGHYPHLVDPDRFVTRLRDFWATS